MLRLALNSVMRNPGRSRTVRYEALVSSPRGTLEELLARIGEKFDPAMLTDLGMKFMDAGLKTRRPKVSRRCLVPASDAGAETSLTARFTIFPTLRECEASPSGERCSLIVSEEKIASGKPYDPTKLTKRVAGLNADLAAVQPNKGCPKKCQLSSRRRLRQRVAEMLMAQGNLVGALK